MKQRRFALAGPPLGISLLVALIPGPCTTFDDVTTTDSGSVENDNDVSNSTDPIVDCGIVLEFPDGSDCVRKVNSLTLCCGGELGCADKPDCVKWFECANTKCPAPRTTACTKQCGSVGVDSGFQPPFNQIAECRTDNADATLSGCVW